MSPSTVAAILSLIPVVAVGIKGPAQSQSNRPRPAQARGVRLQRIWTVSQPDIKSIEAKDGYLLVHLTRETGGGAMLFRAKTGKLVHKVDGAVQSRLQPPLLLTSRWDKSKSVQLMEGWDLTSKARMWAVIVSTRSSIGGLLNGKFYFCDDGGVKCVDPRSGKFVDSRAINSPWNEPSVEVTKKRIYVGRLEHEVYGLLPNDLSRGWKNYCDCSPHVVTEEGFWGTGWPFLAVAVSENGSTKWRKGSYPYTKWRQQFVRQAPVLIGNAFIAAGQLVIDNKGGTYTIISPYLFGMNSQSGHLIWKRPMAATCPVNLKGKVAVLAGHNLGRGGWSIYSGNFDNLETRIEIISARTGRLLWKGAPLQMDGDRFPLLASTSGILILKAGNRIVAYRQA